MHCRLLAVIALTGATALAACADDAAPGPTQVVGPPRLQIVTTCDPAAVRATMATLFTEGAAKVFAIPTFNEAQTKQRAGDATGALSLYYAVINHVLGEYAANRAVTPKRYESTQDAVEFVVSSLYACAGQPVPMELQDAIEAVSGGTDDATVCAAGSGFPVDCTLPNKDATVLAEPGFLDEPALIVIDLDGTDPFTGFHERWSPAWRIRVLPLTAQANYPYYGTGGAYPNAPATAFRAVVGLCVVDRAGESGPIPHPGLEGLVVAQKVASPSTLSPIELVPATTINGVSIDDRLDCTEGTTNTAALTANPFGSSRFAIAGWRALRGVGSTIGSVLAPRPLYAAAFFDGGIGGETISFESWYAAVEPAGEVVISSAGPP
jgi:hypothetical protein